jgi:hypothetical protein
MSVDFGQHTTIKDGLHNNWNNNALILLILLLHIPQILSNAPART